MGQSGLKSKKKGIKGGYKMGFSVGENIETLFKVEPPLDSLEENGFFGYMGVVLRNKELDKIQCHICGEWFDNLTKHFQQAHNLTSEKYRKKFNLPLHFPLCSVSYSQKARATLLYNLSKMAENKKNGLSKEEASKRIEKIRQMATTKKGLANHFYAFNNLSWKNRHGTCPEQLQKRYLAVSDIVGHEPSKAEIEENDGGLYSLIVRRFKTLNLFRKKYGYEVYKKPSELSEESIIGSLRNFAKINKSLPTPKSFSKGSPNTVTIYRRFGSWNRALNCAGLIE